jgi:ribosomal protein S6E (S10)
MVALERVRGMDFDGGGMAAAVDTLLTVEGKVSGGIGLRGIDPGFRKGVVVLGSGVSPEAVVVDERLRK